MPGRKKKKQISSCYKSRFNLLINPLALGLQDTIDSPPSRNKDIVVCLRVLHSEAVASTVSWSWTPTDGLLGLNVPYHYAEDTEKKKPQQAENLYSMYRSVLIYTKMTWKSCCCGNMVIKQTVWVSECYCIYSHNHLAIEIFGCCFFRF